METKLQNVQRNVNKTLISQNIMIAFKDPPRNLQKTPQTGPKPTIMESNRFSPIFTQNITQSKVYALTLNLKLEI